MLKKFFFYVVLYFGIAVIFFATGEVCFRIFRGPPNPLSNVVQRKSEYLFEPGSVQTQTSSSKGEFDSAAHINAFGYRGAEFKKEKQEDKLRIFIVGDSFTFGVGAADNETIPYLIEQKLLASNLNVEVINAGVGNTSPVKHYINIRDIHLQYQPDLVVLLIDLTDLQDDWHSERHAIFDKNGEIVRFDPLIKFGKRDWWLTSTYYSAFCKYIHKQIVRSVWKIQVLGFKEYSRAVKEGKKAKALIANSKTIKNDEVIVEYDMLLFARGDNRKTMIGKHFQRTKRYLTKIKDILAERDIPLMLVTYPYGIYVGGDQWGKGRLYWGFEEGKTYTDRYPFELVEGYARENNIPYTDVLDGFLEADKTKKYFFDYDGHLNPEGNKIVAEAIFSSDDFKRLIKSLK